MLTPTQCDDKLAQAKDLVQEVMENYPEDAHGSAWLEEAIGLIGRSQTEIEAIES